MEAARWSDITRKRKSVRRNRHWKKKKKRGVREERFSGEGPKASSNLCYGERRSGKERRGCPIQTLTHAAAKNNDPSMNKNTPGDLTEK